MTNEQPDGAPQEPTWHLSSPPSGQTPVPHVIAEGSAAATPAPGDSHVRQDPYDQTANLTALDLGRPSDAGSGSAARPGRNYLMTAGLIGAGVIVGIAAVTGLQSLRSTPTAQTAQTTRQGQVLQGQGQQGQVPQGQPGEIEQGQGGVPGAGDDGQLPQGQAGGLDGERRVQGTVTAKSGATITVALTSGSVTVTVLDRTEIVDNGARATLAQVAVGSKVFMHTYPLNGATVAERIFVGAVPQGGPGGGPGQGPDGNGTAPTTAASGSTI